MSRGGRTRSLARRVTDAIMRHLDYRPTLGRINLQVPDEKSVFCWSDKWKLDDTDHDCRHFTVILKLKRKRGMELDIGAEVGSDLFGEPIITYQIFYDRHNKSAREEIYYELLGISAHEIEHLTEEGLLAFQGPRQHKTYMGFPESGKMLHNLNDMHRLFSPGTDKDLWAQRDLIATRNSFENEEVYLICALELNAFVKGFYEQARAARRPIDFFMRSYLNDYVKHGRIQQHHAELVLDIWRTWTHLRFPKARWSDI
jgi:hypothetical protein